jgi:molybdate transport system substrate-binding protein
MQRVSARKYLVILLVLGLFVALAFGVFACGSSAADETTTSAPTSITGVTATTVETVTSSTTASPTTQAAPKALIVSAASSLKAAFTEIGKAFDTANNSTTAFNFDASGTLQKQIEGGAPVDVFASAAPKQINALVDEKLVDGTSVKTFAGNEIVLVVPAASKLGITSFQDLAKADVKKITYGDPKVAPHGVAAEQILTKLNLLSTIKSKIIYAANVSQTLQYVTRDEVDAGIMFVTEAKSAGDKVKIVATADQAWYTKIAYPIGVVSDSKNKTLSQAFIDYVAGAEGQAVLSKDGFLPPPAQ